MATKKKTKTTGKSKARKLYCQECGLVVVVEKECCCENGCCDLICCGQKLKEKK